MPKYKVLRRHQGDRFYERDEIREGTKADLGHLVPHVLEEIEEKAEKAEDAPQNKAEVAPANKAATGRKGKAKA